MISLLVILLQKLLMLANVEDTDAEIEDERCAGSNWFIFLLVFSS